MREARYLDRLGFAVQDVTLHAALQAGRLRAAAEGLAAMLAAYYKARSCCTTSLNEIGEPDSQCSEGAVLH